MAKTPINSGNLFYYALMNIRKLNRVTHRDLGYLFFGMTIIYALSGISLNHIKDWNPNYIVETKEFQTVLMGTQARNEPLIMAFLDSIQQSEHYKKYYFPNENTLKIFIDNGSISIDNQTGIAHLETIKRRPVFYQFNYLHYNHSKKLWMGFSDLYAIGLLLLAITGLFMVKGKHSITRQGALWTVAGILIPLILYLLYI